MPEYNFAIVIVNDPKYGGSGGPVCASSSNEDSFEVLAHEIGHSMAHLADEYSYEGNQPPLQRSDRLPRSQRDLAHGARADQMARLDRGYDSAAHARDPAVRRRDRLVRGARATRPRAFIGRS